MVIPLQLPQFGHLPLELPDEEVLLLALPLRSQVCLGGGLGVIQVLAEHNDYNIFISTQIAINISAPMAMDHRLALCLLTFDPRSNKCPRVALSDPPQGGRPNKEQRMVVSGGSFIPRGGIRSQIQLEKSRRFKNIPLVPALITYSQFPQRKKKTSLQRLSVERERRFCFESPIPRRETIGPARWSPQKVMASSCLTLPARNKFMRYSMVERLRTRTQPANAELND